MRAGSRQTVVGEGSKQRRGSGNGWRREGGSWTSLMRVSARSTPTGRHSGGLAAAAGRWWRSGIHVFESQLTPTPVVWLGFEGPSGGRRERRRASRKTTRGRGSRSRSMRRVRRRLRRRQDGSSLQCIAGSNSSSTSTTAAILE